MKRKLISIEVRCGLWKSDDMGWTKTPQDFPIVPSQGPKSLYFKTTDIIEYRLTYVSEIPGRELEKVIMKILAGFYFDSASVHFLLRSFLSPQALIFAALPHDWPYHLADDSIMTRPEADEAFGLAIIQISKRGRIRSFLGWSGVRVGGLPSWKSDSLHNIITKHGIMSKQFTKRMT